MNQVTINRGVVTRRIRKRVRDWRAIQNEHDIDSNLHAQVTDVLTRQRMTLQGPRPPLTPQEVREEVNRTRGVLLRFIRDRNKSPKGYNRKCALKALGNLRRFSRYTVLVEEAIEDWEKSNA